MIVFWYDRIKRRILYRIKWQKISNGNRIDRNKYRKYGRKGVEHSTSNQYKIEAENPAKNCR